MNEKMPKVGVQLYTSADKVMELDKIIKDEGHFSRNALINAWIDEKLAQRKASQR